MGVAQEERMDESVGLLSDTRRSHRVLRNTNDLPEKSTAFRNVDKERVLQAKSQPSLYRVSLHCEISLDDSLLLLRVSPLGIGLTYNH